VAKGKMLQLLRLDPEADKLHVVHNQEVFGLIRKLMTFRLIGMQRDFLVVGSDSGRIVIVEYDGQK